MGRELTKREQKLHKLWKAEDHSRKLLKVRGKETLLMFSNRIYSQNSVGPQIHFPKTQPCPICQKQIKRKERGNVTSYYHCSKCNTGFTLVRNV